MKCWLPLDTDTDFTLYNFPFGVFQIEPQKPRLASILGDNIIDLAAMNALGFFHELKIDEPDVNNELNDNDQ